jgi:hypothetical protein
LIAINKSINREVQAPNRKEVQWHKKKQEQSLKQRNDLKKSYSFVVEETARQDQLLENNKQ